MRPRSGVQPNSPVPSGRGAVLNVDHAIEVFVHGFAFVRSFAHPFVPEQIEHGIWMMRHADRKSGDYRCEVEPVWSRSRLGLRATDLSRALDATI